MLQEHSTFDALRQALRVLESITDEQFDIDDYLCKTSCKTVGCAVGWCALDPWFNEQGFHMSENWNFPIYKYYGHNGSIYAFFRISSNVATAIFFRAGYTNRLTFKVTRQMVMDKIKNALLGSKVYNHREERWFEVEDRRI